MATPHHTTSNKGLLRDRHLWSRVWEFGRPHRHTFALVALLGVVGTIILLAYPLIYARLVDDLVAGRGVSHVGPIVVGILVLTGTQVALRMWQAVSQTRLTGAIGTELQTLLFDRLQHQEQGFFNVSNSGAITARTVDEAAAATAVFPEALNFAVGNVATLALTVVALLVLDWRSIFAIVFLGLAVLPARRFEQRFRQASLEDFFTSADLKSYTAERLNADGNLLTKLHGDYEHEAAGFRARAARLWGVFVRLGTFRAAIASVVMFGVNAVALLLLVSALALGSTHVGIGTIVAIIVYLRLLEGPLGGIADARLNIARDLIAFTRVLEVLDALPATPTRSATGAAAVDGRGPETEAGSAAGHLVFADVSYVYPTRGKLAVVPSLSLASERTNRNPPSLRGVSFDVRPGSMVALVGPSGAGKSTVAMLAAGILEAPAGRVTIDGRSARDQLGHGREHLVAFVTQDTYLLHDTLRANILYAKPDASDQEVHAACVAAGVHDFAWELPLRYQTLIGENGHRLSGGERQRIALARAILRDPALIVLDEATAHMDTKAEASIQAALDQVFGDRSRLVIAHRLSTVREADTIIVLDGGVVVERGRHEELLELGRLYADLYGTQRAGGTGRPPRKVSGRAQV